MKWLETHNLVEDAPNAATPVRFLSPVSAKPGATSLSMATAAKGGVVAALAALLLRGMGSGKSRRYARA